MQSCFVNETPRDSTPLTPVDADALETWLAGQPARVRKWVSASDFNAAPNSTCFIPHEDGSISRVLAGTTGTREVWALGSLPGTVPTGDYHLDVSAEPEALTQLAIGWGLGAYQFSRYKKPQRSPARLALPATCDDALVENTVAAVYLTRDLINTPAEDMMPHHLGEAVTVLAGQHSAQVTQISGDDLLTGNYPAIHVVGRASVHEPRLIDLRWGDASKPKVTLVGKGVCFDSGGLDLKPSKGMRLMKKDMGGAAHAIGLAAMVMTANLPVRLRLLVPAVENAVSGNAYRPGDIIATRKGLSVEIDNTDAEGRIVLCDALTEAASESPDALVDFATLTGAARVALGTELPAMFSNDDDMAAHIARVSAQENDPVWRLPLHGDYRDMLDSRFADLVNSPSNPFGGAITAALFLQFFVPDSCRWTHFDVMAWNQRSRPGRPEGGEAMGLRAVFGYLRERFAG